MMGPLKMLEAQGLLLIFVALGTSGQLVTEKIPLGKLVLNCTSCLNNELFGSATFGHFHRQDKQTFSMLLFRFHNTQKKVKVFLSSLTLVGYHVSLVCLLSVNKGENITKKKEKQTEHRKSFSLSFHF
jgi:hypothetical protein